MDFSINSTDDLLLRKAVRIAREFAGPYTRDEVVGIVFLGAIVRGYFDQSADIDIAIFKKRGSEIPLPPQYHKVEGIEIHCHLADYEDELNTPWEMAKRWAYSEREIVYDPDGKIAELLQQKLPLRPEEKKWLLMSGLSLSEWYINRLSLLWVERGNLVSAHHMFDEGLSRFFDMLFVLNDALIPAVKWQYYCAERLPRLPAKFRERMQETMTLKAFTLEDIERRRSSFLEMWREMAEIVQTDLHMTYEEINAQV